MKTRRFYIMQLTKPSYQTGLTRFAIYEHTKNGLSVVWEDENGNVPTHMIKSKLKQYPYCHFALKGFQYNKVSKIATSLKEFYQCNISLECIRGWSTSVV